MIALCRRLIDGPRITNRGELRQGRAWKAPLAAPAVVEADAEAPPLESDVSKELRTMPGGRPPQRRFGW